MGQGPSKKHFTLMSSQTAQPKTHSRMALISGCLQKMVKMKEHIHMTQFIVAILFCHSKKAIIFFLFKLVLVTWYDNARSLWWPFELNCLLGATLCVSYLINLHLVSYLINLHLSLVKVTFSDTYNT